VSGLVTWQWTLLFGLATGLAAGALHSALLWRQVRRIGTTSLPGGVGLAVARLFRVASTAALLALGVRLGLGAALGAVLGFWAARMAWLWRFAL
jgi:hypothetical protein